MTARFTPDPPLASADTWAGRKAPRFHNVSCSQCGEDFGPGDHGFSHCADHKVVEDESWRQIRNENEREREAKIEAIWRENMARRDAAAADYGEPATPHELYAGRPGSQAEKIVCDCLRELRDIPEADRLYAHELTDAICAVYLDLAWDAPRERKDAVKISRRTMALWQLFRPAGKKATHGL